MGVHLTWPLERSTVNGEDNAITKMATKMYKFKINRHITVAHGCNTLDL